MALHLPASVLGAAVRARREERGLSQADLATRARLHLTYVSGVESGKRNASWNALVALAAALGVAPSELVAHAERIAGDH